MRALAPLVWILALGIALVVLWRMRTGRRVILRGKWGPRVIRTVVVILVIFGAGTEERAGQRAAAAPKTVLPEKGEALPEVVNPSTVYNWLLLNARQVRGDLESRLSYWISFKQEFVRLSAKTDPGPAELQSLRDHAATLPNLLQPIVLADIDALKKDKPAPPIPDNKLLQALDELERHGYFDHWVNAYLWRKSSAGLKPETVKDRIELYARLHRHARITDALIRAQAVIKPMMIAPRAWMSKAGPSKSERLQIAEHQKRIAELVKEAGTVYASTGAGTWELDALASFTVTGDGAVPTLIRAGKSKELPTGERFRFARLDLLQTPAGDKPVILEHAWLGRIELPANKTLSVWELSDWTPNEARTKLFRKTKEAIEGNKEAAEELEKVLPLAHPFIRDALAQLPQAKGAPRLRMILTLFDDTLMPDLPQNRQRYETTLDGADAGAPPGGLRGGGAFGPRRE